MLRLGAFERNSRGLVGSWFVWLASSVASSVWAETITILKVSIVLHHNQSLHYISIYFFIIHQKHCSQEEQNYLGGLGRPSLWCLLDFISGKFPEWSSSWSCIRTAGCLSFQHQSVSCSSGEVSLQSSTQKQSLSACPPCLPALLERRWVFLY